MDISPSELKQRMEERSTVQLLDVREELEFHTFNIGGLNIPLGTLQQALEESQLDKTKELVVICQRGVRSRTACSILQNAGFTNARNLTGGLLAFRRIAEQIG